MVCLGEEQFRVEAAHLHIEVRTREEARAMEVHPCNFGLEIDCGKKTVRDPSNGSTEIWEPRIYLDPPLPLPGRSLGAFDELTGRFRGVLYVFEHQALREATFTLSRASANENELELSVQGTGAVFRRKLPVRVSTRVQFTGVTVYEHRPEIAATLLREHFDDECLVQEPPDLVRAGRRKWLLFGPVVGRLGSVRYVPATRR